MRSTISIKGARENNLKNIDVEFPRDKLIVMTGLSGSGKSSLAFETIYAEGQRRFLESLSAYSRKFVAQLQKPKVDSILGLSPVISIEQKSVSRNPRSTVGTMTDIYDYFRVLFTTSGTAHCPYCQHEVPTRTPVQIAEHLLALPEGTLIEIDAPIFKIYGEDYPYLFGEMRSKGYRRMRIDDELVDLSEEFEMDETLTYDMEAVIDKFVVKPDIFKPLVVAIENGLACGRGLSALSHSQRQSKGDDRSSFYSRLCLSRTSDHWRANWSQSIFPLTSRSGPVSPARGWACIGMSSRNCW